MRRVRRAVVAACGIVAVWHGCARNNDLGYGTMAGSGGGGGGGTGGGSGGSHHASAAHTTSASSASGAGGSEPNLPTALTVVNGVNDYPAIELCFLPSQTPWPSAAGLPFGTGQVVDAATLPSGSDLTVWLITGDLTQAAGMTCAQIIALAASEIPEAGTPEAGPEGGLGGGGVGGAGGSSVDGGSGGAPADAGGTGGMPSDGGTDAPPPRPTLIAAQLATITSSVLASQRSLLLVPTGCAGGPGHDAPGDAAGCGTGYSSTTPTVGALLAGMSRIEDTKHLSMQFMSASPAMPPMDIGVLADVPGALDVLVASDVTPGQIAPIPPYHASTVPSYGVITGVQIKTYAAGTSTMTSATPLSRILGQGSVTAGDIVNGANLVFVAVGASPGAAAGPFWHALGYALVKANPG